MAAQRMGERIIEPVKAGLIQAYSGYLSWAKKKGPLANQRGHFYFRKETLIHNEVAEHSGGVTREGADELVGSRSGSGERHIG